MIDYLLDGDKEQPDERDSRRDEEQAWREQQRAEQAEQEAEWQREEARRERERAEEAERRETEAREEARKSRELAEEAQAALNACQAQLRDTEAADSALGACENRNRQMQQELQSCAQQLRKKFVLVVISWSTNDDVDLHIIDPAGREYYYEKKFHSGSRAKLEEDNTRGPGNEIWLHPAAEPGRYRVYYKYYSGSGRDVRVRGAVLTPRGRTELPGTVLRRVGEKPWVATIDVDDEGNAQVVAR